MTKQTSLLFLALLGAQVFVSTMNAATVSLTSFDRVEGSTGATSFRFDDYVSNAQPGGQIINNNFLLTTPGTFTGFINPNSAYTTQTLLPDPVGVLVESSSGAVSFLDYTSFQTTSDILGPKTSGETLTFTFVNPSDSEIKVAVEQVAFRFGSVWSSDTVFASFFDIDMNEIFVANAGDEALPPGWASSRGWAATGGILGNSLIHKVQFTATHAINGDAWLVGSFYDSQALPDMAFSGVSGSINSAVVLNNLNNVLVPLPAAAPTGLTLLGGLGVAQFIRRRRLAA